ncbi:MAG TPA: 4-(cytidine 5'-diphospho)-2-C-methyl-D-erythritol kinase [Gemmatimonadales bacterium]|nr:4-(cytidine 5'-diphospho)-2-C-methyl-D-erythritol kinase [Gemmatimonadales bacterium]
MTAAPTLDRVRIAAHAKVNLFLRILAREHSGFHQIETAFLLLELADQIEVRRLDRGVTLDVDGPELGPVEENLAFRAAKAVLEATGAKFGVGIQLNKKIPARAGLGGGSSDAAATLHAVNALAGNGVPRHELHHLAAKLGSDVAFFAAGLPAALGWGRGERLLALAPPPAAPALVALPRDVTVATVEAYRWWDQSGLHDGSRGPVVLEPDSLSTWGSVGRLGANDFELPVFGKHPEIRAVFERLAGTNPYWVRMSGSGSAVAAVYRNERDRDDAISRLGTKDQTTVATATRAHPPAGPTPA